MMENIRKIILESMNDQNIQQKQLAQLMNISPQSLNNILHGRTIIKLEDFLLMYKILNLDIHCIIEESSSDQIPMNEFIIEHINDLNPRQLACLVNLIEYFIFENQTK